MFTSTPISHVVKIKKFFSVLLPTSVVATSAVRYTYSSASVMKRFKCINVKTSLPGTPSFANAKLLKLFLTGVRMLEEHLAASMSMRKMLWARSGTCSKNSISASQVRLKENLVNVWALHTPTPFLPLSIMDSCIY